MVAKKRATAAKGTAGKTAAVKAKKAVSTPITEAMTKAQLYAHIAEATGVARKDVGAVFEELNNVIGRHVKKNGIGQFKLAGLMKVKVVRKPATKSRKGVNPFTGEEMMYKAKPARNVVKVQALKALKELAA